MDAIDKQERLAIDLAGALLEIGDDAPLIPAVKTILEKYGISATQSPPKPGSLWEHKETKERRFVHKNGIGLWWRSCSSDFRGITTPVEVSDWNDWAANATCLVEGVE